jgi:hypothetical protein
MLQSQSVREENNTDSDRYMIGKIGALFAEEKRCGVVSTMVTIRSTMNHSLLPFAAKSPTKTQPFKTRWLVSTLHLDN